MLNTLALGESGPAQAVISPDGRSAVVANYYPGDYVVVSLGSDGYLCAVTDRIQNHGHGPHPRQDSPHPHAVAFDRAGRFLATADLGNDRVQTFDLADGRLEPLGEVAAPTGSGPRHLAFAPDDNALYVIGELDGTITTFAYDNTSGRIGRRLQSILTSPPGFTGTQSGAEIAVHPSGRFLYASNRGSQSIAAYRIDRATATLTAIGLVTEGVHGPTNFAITPDGHRLYVNSSTADTIVRFDIDPATGTLTPSGQVASFQAPNVMTFGT